MMCDGRTVCCLAVVTLTLLGQICATDFEAALAPLKLYDEQRLLGDVPFYRPPDDDTTPTVNAFQELELESNDEGVFFVGERGSASVTNLDVVRDRKDVDLFMMKDNPNSGALPCETVAKDDADYLCQNYITVIQPIDNNRVIVCGSNGLVPVCYQCSYNAANDDLNCPSASDGNNQCPSGTTGSCYYIGDTGLVAHEPLQKTAWLYTRDAISAEEVYTGANEEQNQDSVISRVKIDGDGKLMLDSVIKTDKDDPDWLNNAEFVGDPIEYEGHIYFFFRETATEYINAGKIVYSRVGRICKNDEGGGPGTMLDGKWTTFQKARLNCSTQGDFPFYFNELQDIHQAVNHEQKVIYAAFSTPETGATGSAVCVFRLDEIQELFANGAFKGAATPSELWLPVDKSAEPDPRPGSCVTHPSSSFSFIKEYPLMDPLVPNTRDYPNKQSYEHDSNSPLGILQGERIVQLVVDERVRDAAGSEHDIFFLASDDGKIFKMYMPSASDPVLIEEYNLQLDQTVNEKVVTMKLKDKKLYIGTTERVVAVAVQHCDTYEKCYLCVQAQDPYCSFKNNMCESETTGGKQCLRETRDKKPFDCTDDPCSDWPKPMIAFASDNETYVVNGPDMPINLYFTATGPKYSDLSYEFECTCGDGRNCSGSFTQIPKYQRLDKVEWVSVTFKAQSWDMTCEATIKYRATANEVTEERTSTIKVDDSTLVADPSYSEEITHYDELMAGYRYNVKKWEEDAIKTCYPDDISTCSPAP